LARVDPDVNPAVYQPPLLASRPILPLVPEDELETPPLPREHPKWVNDAVAVSQRARQLVTRLKPVIIRVLAFWDHRARGIAIGGRELTVDFSGSYRLD
jgi:hypothetical protein